MSTLSSIDLNLLVAFEALLEENNVTRAAARTGVSQSAMSHSLRRLRRLLGDALFVRVGSAMRPTPRARELRQPVREALQRVEQVLAPPVAFDPQTFDGSFRVLAGDGTQVLFVPALSRRLGELAPRARLDVRELVQGQLVEHLASGDADLALCFAADLELPASLVHEPLLADRLVCVVRQDLEGVGDRLDWQSFAALGHVMFLPRGTAYPITQTIDRALGASWPRAPALPDAADRPPDPRGAERERLRRDHPRALG